MKTFRFQAIVISLMMFLGLLNCTTKPEDVVTAADGVPVKFSVKGEGEPTLIFVHGWSADRTSWDAQVEHFSGKYRTVAVDLPGYGESGNTRDDWTMEMYGRDIAAIIQQLEADEAILIGHSMGGFAIVVAARVLPEKIIGLVPVDVFHDVERKLTSERIDEWIARNMAFVSNPTEEIIGSAYKIENDTTAIRRIIEKLTSSPKIGWEESLRDALDWTTNDLTNALTDLKVPIVCINSDRFPMKLETARKYTPMFDVKIVEGVGHGVMTEAPDEFNRLLGEIIEEFKHYTLSTDGVQIKFDVQGEGEPTLFFVHGFAGDMGGWDNQLSHFSKKYKVVAIDLPGFGLSGNNRKHWSMKTFGDDILSVIENLNLENVILVGHSMGGAVILEAARQKTGDITGLVPCDVFHDVESKLTDEFVERARKSYGKALERTGWEETGMAYVDWRNNELTNILKEIQIPIICINSDRLDNRVEIAREYAQQFDVRIIEGVGHGVMTEAPDEFNRLLEDIIQNVE